LNQSLSSQHRKHVATMLHQIITSIFNGCHGLPAASRDMNATWRVLKESPGHAGASSIKEKSSNSIPSHESSKPPIPQAPRPAAWVLRRAGTCYLHRECGYSADDQVTNAAACRLVRCPDPLCYLSIR